MAVLITGATGFIGSHVTRHLANEGEKVIAFDIVSSMRLIEDVKHKIEFVQGNLLDLPLILNTIKKHDVTKVIHLAYSPIDVTTSNPYLGMETDIIGMNNIFEAARILDLKPGGLDELDRRQWPASFYGGEHALVNEDSPTKPGTIYGADKVLNEFVSKFYCDRYGLDIICLRPAHIYGPGKRLVGKQSTPA